MPVAKEQGARREAGAVGPTGTKTSGKEYRGEHGEAGCTESSERQPAGAGRGRPSVRRDPTVCGTRWVLARGREATQEVPETEQSGAWGESRENGIPSEAGGP